MEAGVRQFNAINGRELAEAIALQIAEQMDGDQNFRQHLTFPVVEWAWKLEVKAYPVSEDRILVSAGGRGANREAIEKVVEAAVAAAPDSDVIPDVYVMEGGQERTDQPDTIREKAKLPVAKTGRDGRGVLIDK
jgi:hypothetical protein